MTKYPHNLTLRAVCAAIEAFEAQQDNVPESGMIAAFEILLTASGILQRAEAAEAKQAELEKQKSVALLDVQRGRSDGNKFALTYTGSGHALADDVYELFTRPAPAVSLAELVPDERFRYHESDYDDGHANGWNACRAEILRNIEDAG